MNKKNVVLSAIHFPLTMARYFWEALEDRDDVNLWVTGPFTGNWIPWNNGMTLDQKYVKQPNFPLPQSSMSQNIPASFINNQVPFPEVDLWLDIDAGWCVSGRPSKAKIFAQIQTDPHVLKDRYNKHKSQYDYSFCMQSPYQESGEIYLPYGYSKRYHFPEAVEKEYDVCMIGLNYQHRDTLARKLQAIGFKVKTGIGIVYDDYRHEYNKSKIALCWSSLQDLPARFWEGLAMNIPVVSNRLPDIEKNGFVDMEDYIGFSSDKEAIVHINFLLANLDVAERIANSGYNKVTSGHSWDDRVQFIMEKVGLV